MALRRTDGHAVWVSHAALALTLDQLPGKRWPENEEIDGGEIIRDEKGDPTGEHFAVITADIELRSVLTRCFCGQCDPLDTYSAVISRANRSVPLTRDGGRSERRPDLCTRCLCPRRAPRGVQEVCTFC